jgi:hypothetical protein
MLLGIISFMLQYTCLFTFEMLLQAGALSSLQNKFDETPLDVAKKKKFGRVVTVLAADQLTARPKRATGVNFA